MNWPRLLIVAVMLMSAGITMFTAIYSYKGKGTPAAKYFVLLFFSCTIFSFGYAMELACSDMNSILFWNLFKYPGVSFIGSFWLLASIYYSENEKLIGKGVRYFIFLIPCLTLLFRYTNSITHFFYTGMSLVDNGFITVLHVEKGPWYYGHSVYTTFCVVYSNMIYLRMAMKARGKLKKQPSIMFAASIIPWIAYTIMVLGISPYGIDFSSIAIAIASILFVFGLFRYQFLELLPLAREKVFESIKEAVFILDGKFRILDYNYAALTMFEGLKETNIGNGFDDISGSFKDIADDIMNREETVFEYKINGKINYYNAKTSEINDKDKNVAGYVILISDISEQVESARKLEQMAVTDGLTGIYNRRYFFERARYELEQSKRNSKPVSLAIFDLDNFKVINDTYGHQAGDAVLVNVAATVKAHSRSIDLFGRFGGEEFIMLFPETSVEQAEEALERLRFEIEKAEILFEDKVLKVTASFGLTSTQKLPDMDMDHMVKLADTALYAAKSEGRNRISIKEL